MKRQTFRLVGFSAAANHQVQTRRITKPQLQAAWINLYPSSNRQIDPKQIMDRSISALEEDRHSHSKPATSSLKSTMTLASTGRRLILGRGKSSATSQNPLKQRNSSPGRHRNACQVSYHPRRNWRVETERHHFQWVTFSATWHQPTRKWATK